MTAPPGDFWLLIARYLIRKGVDHPLRNAGSHGFGCWVLLHELRDGILLAELRVRIDLLSSGLDSIHIIQKLERSLAGSYDEGAEIKIVAVVGEEEVEIVWVRRVLQRLLDDISDLDIRIRDQGVKVEPPYPVPLVLLDQAPNHVKLPPDRAYIPWVGFVIDNKVVAMAADVVYPCQ